MSALMEHQGTKLRAIWVIGHRVTPLIVGGRVAVRLQRPVPVHADQLDAAEERTLTNEPRGGDPAGLPFTYANAGGFFVCQSVRDW